MQKRKKEVILVRTGSWPLGSLSHNLHAKKRLKLLFSATITKSTKSDATTTCDRMGGQLLATNGVENGFRSMLSSLLMPCTVCSLLCAVASHTIQYFPDPPTCPCIDCTFLLVSRWTEPHSTRISEYFWFWAALYMQTAEVERTQQLLSIGWGSSWPEEEEAARLWLHHHK